jgi:sterol desaturase/sphingolipid hydroxylase (fatty acid hydroxylase superfamily)
MLPWCARLPDVPLQTLCNAKTALTLGLFLLFWGWETLAPFFDASRGRLRHALRNLTIALLNTVILVLVFGSATILLSEWAALHAYGLLHLAGFDWPWRLIVALLVLDLWMYVWHRLNHALPILWRFHRMHHSDPAMDVTTATRFHLGEHVLGMAPKLALIPLIGLEAWQIILYESLVVAITFFHHANISLGRLDRVLRLVIVSPDFHKLHHSRWQPETDSNFSTVFSFWDRLAGTFRMRTDVGTIEFGLEEIAEEKWQTVGGMLRTPAVTSMTNDQGRMTRECPRTNAQFPRHEHPVSIGH